MSNWNYYILLTTGNPSQVIRYSRWPAACDQLAGPLPISAQAIVGRRSYRLLSLHPTVPATGELVSFRSDDPTHQAACMVCRECGGNLQFEFQVMPQLLYYLGVDRHTKIVRPEKLQPVDAASTNTHTAPSPTPTELFHNSSEEVILN